MWGDQGTINEIVSPDEIHHWGIGGDTTGFEEFSQRWDLFNTAFPDLEFGGAADLIAEGDHVVGRWEGGGTHTGAAFDDFVIGALPAASGRKMHFTGTTVLRVENGRISEEVGLDDGVTALRQLGLIRPV